MLDSFTDQQLASFRDPETYRAFRQLVDRDLNSAHRATEQNHPMQVGFRKILEQIMHKKLETRPDIARSLIPDFPVACKRLTPGPGYLESLLADNVRHILKAIHQQRFGLTVSFRWLSTRQRLQPLRRKASRLLMV